MAETKSDLAESLPETPELDKMRRAREELHTEDIGHFLAWLQDTGIVLARWDRSGKRLVRDYTSILSLLAKYTGVDLRKVEVERQELLDALLKNPEAVETCDECGHRPAVGNVVYADNGSRPLCPSCNGIDKSVPPERS